jgi:ABC-type multidrug transport system fused ATPase/permease subunit
LLRIKKEVLYEYYKKRRRTVIFTIIGAIFLLCFLMFMLVSSLEMKFVLRIREVYLFREEIEIGVDNAILSTLIWSLPTNLFIIIIIMVNIHSVYFKKYVNQLLAGIQCEEAMDNISRFIIQNKNKRRLLEESSAEKYKITNIIIA